jgi:chromosome segregation ATPase
MAVKKILIRRDTTANFEYYNPTLSNGEFGIELCSDGSRKVKIGNGYTPWNELGYAINDAEYSERLDQIQEQGEERDLLLETLEETITNLETTVAALQEANTGQDTKLEELTDQYTETIQRLSAITTALANQGSVLTTLLAQIESLAQNQVTDETISEIIQSIAACDAIIAELREIQATQGDTLGTLEDTQASQDQTLSTLNQACTELQDQLQGIQTALSVVKNVWEQVQQETISQAAAIAELMAIKSSLPGNLGALENQVANLAETVGEAQIARAAKDQEHDTAITGLQGAIRQEQINRIQGDTTQAQALEAATAALDAKIYDEIAVRSGETSALDTKIDAEIAVRSDMDTALQSQITGNHAVYQAHEEDTDNPHGVTKAQVGLAQVDNTADADKPVSTAQAAAIAETLTASKTYTNAQIQATINGTLHYKGDVETYADLPLENERFDLWHVLDTGKGYYWFGGEWNLLDFSVDLSAYYTTEETDTLLGDKVAKEPGKGLSQNDFSNSYLQMLQALAGELKVFHDGIEYRADGYEDILVTRYMLRSDLSITNSSIEISFDGVKFRVVATSTTNLRTEVLSAKVGETVIATIRRNTFYNGNTEGQTIQNRALDDTPYIIDSTIYVESNDYSIYQIFVGGHWWEINLWPANAKAVVLMSLERRL